MDIFSKNLTEKVTKQQLQRSSNKVKGRLEHVFRAKKRSQLKRFRRGNNFFVPTATCLLAASSVPCTVVRIQRSRSSTE